LTSLAGGARLTLPPALTAASAFLAPYPPHLDPASPPYLSPFPLPPPPLYPLVHRPRPLTALAPFDGRDWFQPSGSVVGCEGEVASAWRPAGVADHGHRVDQATSAVPGNNTACELVRC